MSVEKAPPEVDYVVVGAGSAGCVLAARLSQDGTTRVLLIEAGGPGGHRDMMIPAAFPRLFGTEHDWAFTSQAQPGLNDRGIYWPRGKALGGSSSINAQIWTRGHRADYDGWAAAGLSGWGYDAIEPAFDRAEETLGITGLRDPNPTTADFLTACQEAGLREAGDVTRPEGYEPIRVNQRNGRRWSAADGYLRPAQQRANLTVVTGVTVRRVVLEGTRAVGVELDDGGGPRIVRARAEVILSAGAVGSPHLLMLSGIGDAAELGRVGTPVRVELPGVGRGLQDHLFVPLALAAREAISPGVGDQSAAALEYFRSRTGRLSSNLAEAVAWARTDPGLPAPDLELLWMPVPYLDHGRGPDRGHGVTLSVVLLQPASTGRITLRDNDPGSAPLIEPGYLSDPEGADLRTLRAGVEQGREILTQPALKRWLGDPLLPGVLDGTEADVTGLIRSSADTLYHPVSTCRAGTDPDAVLDAGLRVRGTEGLRVVDASALPTIPRAHTHAPTVMLAERAADLIRS